MLAAPLKTSYQLTIIIAILAAVAAAGGLSLAGLYRDSYPYKTAWLGNDLVTLLVVVPLLIISLVFSQRGSQRGKLVWLGLLSYLFYNYAFYLFGAAFNWFFLLYVALFSLAIYTLALGLYTLDVRGLSNNFRPETPRISISLFLLFVSLPLGIFEIGQCLNFIFTNKVPAVPSLIFALDLSIVVPNTVLAAILLWKKHPWGYVLSLIMLVKAFTYGLVLSLSTALIASFSLTSTWDPLMPFYVFVAFGGLIGSVVLLINLKANNLERKSKHQPEVTITSYF